MSVLLRGRGTKEPYKMTTPPPPGLPGFLRRSLRPAAPDDRDSSEADDAVAAALAGGPTPPSSGQFRPATAFALPPPAATAPTTPGRDAVTGAGPGTSEPEPPLISGGSRDDTVEDDNEEDRLRLEAENEANEAASRVDRRFRFGLSLGGRRRSDEAASDGVGGSVLREWDDGAIQRPGSLKERSRSVPSVGSQDDSRATTPTKDDLCATSSHSSDNLDRTESSPSLREERKMSYKDLTYQKTITAPVVNLRDLRKSSWNGIPPSHRPLAWKMLLGYLPANAGRREGALRRKRAEYWDAVAQHYDADDDARTGSEQETLRQVLVDVPRTAPDIGLFRVERVRTMLGRLLFVWACRHPASSYVQGINDLATPLICVFLSEYVDANEGGAPTSSRRDSHGEEEDDGDGDDDGRGRLDDVLDGGSVVDDLPDSALAEVEADVYWCLTNLLSGIQDHYTADQPGVQRMVMRLEELVSRIDANLALHLRETGVQFIQFAFRWMNCLLLREFNLRCVVRLWDAYLSEEGGAAGGFETFHVYVCAAFLCQFSGEVRGMEFDRLFGFMQAMPTDDWGDGEVEILLSQAFVLSTLFEGSDAHLTAAANPLAG